MAASWFLRAAKMAPHMSMVFLQLIAATYIVLSKVMLVQGISSTVFLAYQFILATVVLGAFALIFERPPLSRSILYWIFLLAFLGYAILWPFGLEFRLYLCSFVSLSWVMPKVCHFLGCLFCRVTLAQNLLSASLYYISSTLQASVLNMMPIFTYMLSILAREDKLEIRTIWGKGKLFGTLLSVSGALTLVLWHGPAAFLLPASSGQWMLGFAMVIGGVLATSAWILLLRPVSIRYPADLSMNTLMLFFSALQTLLVAAITRPKASQWSVKWDLKLLNIAFGGILNSGLGYLLCTWCATLKGPVFIASFSPLCLVFATIFEAAFQLQVLRMSSIIGSIMVVSGLYFYLWAKDKEEASNTRDEDNIPTTYLLSNYVF